MPRRFAASSIWILILTALFATRSYSQKMVLDTGVWGPQPEMRPKTVKKSPNILPFRSWALQNTSIDRAKKTLEMAPKYGVTNIQLSHGLVMNATDVINNAQKIKDFNAIISRAHELGITIHIWTHEFNKVPDSIKNVDQWFDKDEIWKVLEERYNKLFEVLPGLDGIVLTLHETDHLVFNIKSVLPVPKRIAKLTNFINGICLAHKAQLVLRTFAYKITEVQDVVEAFADIDTSVIEMSKCVPQDWEVFYPHNVAIGRWHDRKHIIEFDFGAEYYGEGKIPYLYPEYLHMRLNYERERNSYGYVVRVERSIWPTVVPCIEKKRPYNEFNLYAIKRFSESAAVTPDEVWAEFYQKEAGKGRHTDLLVQALKLTDDVVNRCNWLLGTWYNDHSGKPSAFYVEKHIESIIQFNPQYTDVVARLMKPDARAVGEVYSESDEALFLAKASSEILDSAKAAGLTDSLYTKYRTQIDTLVGYAKVWSAWRKNYIDGKSGNLSPVYTGAFPVGGPPRIDMSKGVKTIIAQMVNISGITTGINPRLQPVIHEQTVQLAPAHFTTTGQKLPGRMSADENRTPRILFKTK